MTHPAPDDKRKLWVVETRSDKFPEWHAYPRSAYITKALAEERRRELADPTQTGVFFIPLADSRIRLYRPEEEKK